MKSFIVSDLDPAEAGDPAANVVVQGTWPEKKIYTRMAKQFTQHESIRIDVILQYLLKVKKKINPHVMSIERNKQGNKFADYFDKRGLVLKRVSTSANLKDSTKLLGLSVDKPYMVKWLTLQKKHHNILFSNDTTDKDMQELIDQIPQIINVRSPGGFAQRSQLGRHDDLFVSFLRCCNVIRLWWNEMDTNKAAFETA